MGGYVSDAIGVDIICESLCGEGALVASEVDTANAGRTESGTDMRDDHTAFGLGCGTLPHPPTFQAHKSPSYGSPSAHYGHEHTAGLCGYFTSPLSRIHEAALKLMSPSSDGIPQLRYFRCVGFPVSPQWPVSQPLISAFRATDVGPYRTYLLIGRYVHSILWPWPDVPPQSTHRPLPHQPTLQPPNPSFTPLTTRSPELVIRMPFLLHPRRCPRA